MGLRAAACGVGMLWVSGCSSLNCVNSSTLSTILDPASAHHADYLEYQQGRLTKAQLLDRLPYIALIGDSLSRDFFVSSFISSLWRSKMNHRRDWFLDVDASTNSVYSVYEHLERVTPLVASEYASVGGHVDSGAKVSRFLECWWPQRFSQQVDLILRNKRFPDLLMIWIGHNNLDWVTSVDSSQRDHAEDYLGKTADAFRQKYARQLGRLVDRAQDQKQRNAIIVFGLVNFRTFFVARDAAEELRRNDPRLYPYFEVDYQRFESMKPEYRGNMVKLALMMNEKLRDLVGEFNQQLAGDSLVRLEYSDALATVDISAADLIHPMDAWHPSPKGHSVLAVAAYGALGPSLNFLGIPLNQGDPGLR